MTRRIGGEQAVHRAECHGVGAMARRRLGKVAHGAGIADAPVAGLLDIPAGTQVVSRTQDRYIDRIPWSRQVSFYLMDFITKGATKLLMALDIEEGSVRYLDNEIGVRQTGYRDWITGRLATEEEQAFFGIGHNAAVFVDSRVAFDQNNTPMRLTVTIFPVDRNQLIVNVGPNVPELTDKKNLGRDRK